MSFKEWNDPLENGILEKLIYTTEFSAILQLMQGLVQASFTLWAKRTGIDTFLSKEKENNLLQLLFKNGIINESELQDSMRNVRESSATICQTLTKMSFLKKLPGTTWR